MSLKLYLSVNYIGNGNIKSNKLKEAITGPNSTSYISLIPDWYGDEIQCSNLDLYLTKADIFYYTFYVPFFQLC